MTGSVSGGEPQRRLGVDRAPGARSIRSMSEMNVRDGHVIAPVGAPVDRRDHDIAGTLHAGDALEHSVDRGLGAFVERTGSCRRRQQD
jgi:hypothetical protein